jgi:hypothetical protein
MSLQSLLLTAVEKAAIRHIQERTPAAERELRTALRDLDGWRLGKFIPFVHYHPALSDRGELL